jgi:hypothetical protein
MLRRPVAVALFVGAALTPVTLPAVTGAAPACAAATGPHAALVIETGTQDLRYCVALDAPTVSGIHLIELAGSQQHLQYAFGSGGQAVCRLDGVGPQGDDCFADYPDFWGYWHGDGHGGWNWSSTGAASAQVGDGDLDGWVWGKGDSGTTHAKPPALTTTDVCVPAPPSPAPTTAPPARSPSTPHPSGAPPTRSHPMPASPSPVPRSSESPDGGEVTDLPASSPPIVAAAAAQDPPPASGGPGPGLVLALAFGAALAGGGWLRFRGARRHGETGGS